MPSTYKKQSKKSELFALFMIQYFVFLMVENWPKYLKFASRQHAGTAAVAW